MIDFATRISTQGYSEIGSVACIILPRDVLDYVNEHKIKRVLIQIKGMIYNRAPLSDGQGGRYIMVSKDMLRQLACGIGAMVEVSLKPDPNPTIVDLPEELEAVIEQDEAFGAFFKALKLGAQRSYTIYVSSAKTIDTRIKRSLELAHKAKQGILFGQQAYRRKAQAQAKQDKDKDKDNELV